MLAEARNISIGKALSQLARRGVRTQTPLSERNGFSVFVVGPRVLQFGLDDVHVAIDAEDQAQARPFVTPGV